MSHHGSGADLAPASAVCADDRLETLRIFAERTGRCTAVTVHLWLWGDPASEGTAVRRDQFADLVDAMLPDGDVPIATVRGWRIGARAAQGALLSAATLRRGARAQATAQALIARCDRLLAGV